MGTDIIRVDDYSEEGSDTEVRRLESSLSGSVISNRSESEGEKPFTK